METKHQHHSYKQFQIQAKWSHTEGFQGWKHFRIVSNRGTGPEREVELMAVCDRHTRFWLSVGTLKKDPKWCVGWLD